jgi:FkbM family methyltransferase
MKSSKIFGIFGQYLYNSVISDLLKSHVPSPPIPHTGKKMNIITRLKLRCINFILKFSDPIVYVYEGKTKLRMRLSHTNVLCYALFPMYDKALPRISVNIQEIAGKLIVIDVGANIGDTATLISEKVNGASILCVEGNEKVLEFLNYNIKFIRNNSITIEPRFCTDFPSNTGFSVDMHYGTAKLVKDETSSIQGDTLDNMVNRNSVFQDTNLLKIDTDGFEITVFNGAKKIIQQIQPIIYFEFNPHDYEKAGQDTFYLFDLLASAGYKKALFYTNCGIPLGIYDITDKQKMKELINNLAEIENGKTIYYYYDILLIPENKYNIYHKIFQNEMAFLPGSL